MRKTKVGVLGRLQRTGQDQDLKLRRELGAVIQEHMKDSQEKGLDVWPKFLMPEKWDLFFLGQKTISKHG